MICLFFVPKQTFTEFILQRKEKRNSNFGIRKKDRFTILLVTSFSVHRKVFLNRRSFSIESITWTQSAFATNYAPLVMKTWNLAIDQNSPIQSNWIHQQTSIENFTHKKSIFDAILKQVSLCMETEEWIAFWVPNLRKVKNEISILRS